MKRESDYRGFHGAIEQEVFFERFVRGIEREWEHEFKVREIEKRFNLWEVEKDNWIRKKI